MLEETDKAKRRSSLALLLHGDTRRGNQSTKNIIKAIAAQSSLGVQLCRPVEDQLRGRSWLSVSPVTGTVNTSAPLDRESPYVRDNKYTAVFIATDNASLSSSRSDNAMALSGTASKGTCGRWPPASEDSCSETFGGADEKWHCCAGEFGSLRKMSAERGVMMGQVEEVEGSKEQEKGRDMRGDSRKKIESQGEKE
ncbi:Cadherin-13 [Liparis tanakae]|uniref:Cadherin-13 n=1 Tax=Liparis tanakae TaxID=230148 RepID=A0A4Z2J485_9TELE|nr:Cadherin-13 [Liparis tanakae]